MKKLVVSALAILMMGVISLPSCGPSKTEKEVAAKLDSIRKADSIANLEKEKERMRQELLDSINKANKGKKSNGLKNTDALTQYALITPDQGGPHFRTPEALKSILKKIGFSVKTFKYPDYLEGEDFTVLKASRPGAGGTTTIQYDQGMDPTMYIDFANKSEVDQFVESMVVSKYSRSGNKYYNPKNNMNKIGVKVTGTSVVIMNPFEMFPDNF